MTKGISRYKLIYGITIHPQLGNTIEAYKIKLNDDDSFSMTFGKITSQSINEEDYEVSDVDKEVIRLITEYTENGIVDKFAKKSRYFVTFLEKEWTKEKFETFIRPFIERRLLRVLNLLIKSGTPLYYKGDKNEFFKETPVHFNPDPSEVFFNFIRNEEEIRYFINIHSGERKIGLLDKRFCILTFKPSYILIDNELLSFHSEVNSRKILPFFTKEHVSVAISYEQKYFETFIVNTLREQDNVQCKGFDLELIRKKPKPVLRIALDLELKPIVKLSFNYGNHEFSSAHDDSSHVKLIRKKNQFKVIKTARNFAAEERISRKLKKTGLKLLNKYAFSPADYPVEVIEDIISWLNLKSEQLAKAGIQVVNEYKNKVYFTGKTDLVLEVTDKIDWFDVNATIRFGEFSIPLVKLRKHILYGKREYILPDGSIGVIPEEWLTRVKDLLVFSKTNEDTLKVDRQHVHLLGMAGQKNQPDLKKKISTHRNDKEGHGATKLPVKLNATLRDYQQKGYDWLYYLSKNHLGACLADDMGLGKTFQALAVLLKYKEETSSLSGNNNTVQFDLFNFSSNSGIRKPSLIVVPTSLIFNWVNEIHKFTPSLIYYVHSGSKRSISNDKFHLFDLIITSYGTLRNDIDLFREDAFAFVILDESQNIKNPASKIFKSIMTVQADYRIALTGTPIENGLSDLWAQMSYLNPGLLGEFSYFKKKFQIPIEKNNNEVQRDKLKKLIQPFVLRRTKNEVAKELPELSENIRYCEMTDKQKKIYDKHKSAVRNMLFKSTSSFDPKGRMITVLKGLMRLRQLANHPLLLDEKMDLHDSGKFIEVVESMENILSEGHKILVFSAFETHLKLFRTHCENEKIGYEFLSGKVKGENRKKVIESFQNDKRKDILLATLKTGGVGLNLTAAEYVFLLDPWWNPASELQAVNRAHRIGQENKVFAYKFITRESIEEKILGLQNKKKSLAKEFIDTNNPLRDLKVEEIAELFE